MVKLLGIHSGMANRSLKTLDRMGLKAEDMGTTNSKEQIIELFTKNEHKPVRLKDAGIPLNAVGIGKTKLQTVLDMLKRISGKTLISDKTEFKIPDFMEKVTFKSLFSKLRRVA